MKVGTSTEKDMFDLLNVFDEQVQMGVDATSLNLMMHTLTNLYSNPYQAVAREYLSNAFDSHIQAGCVDVAVKVTLPTLSSPALTIQDFGVGLSRDELVNVYSKYWASTKRDSDSFVGGFGLGAKSAFAITEQFTIRSVKDGLVNEVIINKENMNAPVLSFLPVQEASAGESSGVTVKIPVEAVSRMRDVFDDVAFRRAWYVVPVEVDGRKVEDTVAQATCFVPGLGWYFEKTLPASNYRTTQFLLGPVSYQTGVVPSRASSSHFVLDVPYEAVSIAPDRENIIEDEKTLSYLRQQTNAATQWVQDRLAEEWEAASVGRARSEVERQYESLFGAEALSAFLNTHGTHHLSLRPLLEGSWEPYEGGWSMETRSLFCAVSPHLVATWREDSLSKYPVSRHVTKRGIFPDPFSHLKPADRLIVVEDCQVQQVEVPGTTQVRDEVVMPTTSLRHWLGQSQHIDRLGFDGRIHTERFTGQRAMGQLFILAVPGKAEDALSEEGKGWANLVVSADEVKEFSRQHVAARRAAARRERQENPPPAVNWGMLEVITSAAWPVSGYGHGSGESIYVLNATVLKPETLPSQQVLLLAPSVARHGEKRVKPSSETGMLLSTLTAIVLSGKVSVVCLPKGQHQRFMQAHEHLTYLSVDEAFALAVGDLDTVSSAERLRLDELSAFDLVPSVEARRKLLHAAQKVEFYDKGTGDAFNLCDGRLLALRMSAEKEQEEARNRGDLSRYKRLPVLSPSSERYPLLEVAVTAYSPVSPQAVFDYLNAMDKTSS